MPLKQVCASMVVCVCWLSIELVLYSVYVCQTLHNGYCAQFERVLTICLNALEGLFKRNNVSAFAVKWSYP